MKTIGTAHPLGINRRTNYFGDEWRGEVKVEREGGRVRYLGGVGRDWSSWVKPVIYSTLTGQ